MIPSPRKKETKRRKRKRYLWRGDYWHAIYSSLAITWIESASRAAIIDRSNYREKRGGKGHFRIDFIPFDFTIASIVPWFKLCLTNARYLYDRAGLTLIVIQVNIGNYLNGSEFRSPGKWKCFFQKFDRRNLTRPMNGGPHFCAPRSISSATTSFSRVEINCIVYFILIKEKGKSFKSLFS